MAPSAISAKPLIRPCCVAEKYTACPTKGINSKSNKENEVTGQRESSDLLLRGFWARETNCIVDVRVTTTSNLQTKSSSQAKN
jgi:hypothetical protein